MKYVVSEPMSQQEQLSALHDGQLDAAQAAALVKASLNDESIMQQWRSMSVISQVLREQQGYAVTQPALSKIEVPQTLQPQQEAANDGVFRWKMVAGFAALAAVGSLVWGLLGAVGEKAGMPQGAVMANQQVAPAVSPASQGLITVGSQIAGQEVTMIRDPRLDELLAAHKQFGGVSALQQPAGSLRSVSLAAQRP
ncbi:RseA family anti-sigma factor [Variovorax sp. PCZ-1]|uniref:sigma-E factor negative regulatory protein n=1 Tax=Variovorax sp. PCZ-1 TaxID=2835533 RepID=UPI001BD037B4|nr:RseA family anti-sigma factor [Variovorax sp. PCZ-1]MBS7808944.1 anti-anti-sigma factor [Variovorax sp. PCZ-1]